MRRCRWCHNHRQCISFAVVFILIVTPRAGHCVYGLHTVMHTVDVMLTTVGVDEATKLSVTHKGRRPVFANRQNALPSVQPNGAGNFQTCCNKSIDIPSPPALESHMDPGLVPLDSEVHKRQRRAVDLKWLENAYVLLHVEFSSQTH